MTTSPFFPAFYGLTTKNMLLAWRNKRFWLSLVILPLLLTVGAGYLTTSLSFLHVSPFPVSSPSVWGSYPSTPLPVVLTTPPWPSLSSFLALLPSSPTYPSPHGYTSFPSLSALADATARSGNASFPVGLSLSPASSSFPTLETLDVDIRYAPDEATAEPWMVKTLAQMVLASRRNSSVDATPIAEVQAPINNSDVGQAFVWLLFGPLMMSYSIGFFMAGFTTRVVEERASGTRDLLLAMGCPLSAWWASFFVFHYAVWVGVAAASLGILYAFGAIVVTANTVAAPIAFLSVTGASLILSAYLLAFLFSSPESCARVVRVLITLIVVVPYVIVTVVLDNPSSPVLQTLLSIFPTYALYRGWTLMGLYVFTRNPATASNLMEPHFQMGALVGVQAGYAVLACLTIFAIEWFSKPASSASSSSSQSVPPSQDLEEGDVSEQEVDEDVVAEAARVAQDDGTCVIRVANVTKVYGSGDDAKVANANISFGVGSSECLGLLGPNGAGKSTLALMLSGKQSPTGGSVATHGKVGVCAQKDSLWDTLTGREHMRLYARIKGLSSAQMGDAMATLADTTGLTPHLDALSSTYSGGTKRKLSLALAFLGNPDVVLLDEPSAGVDVAARHAIWDIVTRLQPGTTILLTTHSMDEAEKLCGRVCMIVGGRVRAIGSVQHLKAKFGASVRVVMGAPAHDAASSVALAMENAFPEAELISDNFGTLTYSIPREASVLSDLVRTITTIARDHGVDDYSFSQSTLESVFLRLVQLHQHQPSSSSE